MGAGSYENVRCGCWVLQQFCFADLQCLRKLRQRAARGHVIVPTSSIPVPGRPATDLLIFVPEGAPVAQSGPPPGAETPASLACVYKLTKQVKGCPINGTTEVPTGGANAIAVVEVGLYSKALTARNLNIGTRTCPRRTTDSPGRR
jgi:hypothetical protein